MKILETPNKENIKDQIEKLKLILKEFNLGNIGIVTRDIKEFRFVEVDDVEKYIIEILNEHFSF